MAKTQDVATVTDGTIVVPDSVKAMVSDIRSRITDLPADADQISYDILGNILGGTWEDAMSGVADIDDILDADGKSEPMSFTGVSWQDSNKGDFALYAVIHCIAMDGKSIVITNGGHNVVALMYRAEQEGRFPFTARFTRRTTRRGYPVYRIVMA